MSVLNDPDCGWIKNIPKRTNVKTLNKGGFIATGCGQVMNNRRKTTKIY